MSYGGPYTLLLEGARGYHTRVTQGARRWQPVVPMSRDADATTKMSRRQ